MAGPPAAVAAEALATWLGGQPGLSLALRGWPEREEDLDLASGPVVSVTQAGEATYDWCSPVPIAEDLDGAEVLVTWRLGDFEVEFQLDVWAAFRATRDAAAALVEAALHDDLFGGTGLELALGDAYFDQVLGVILVSSQALDDADAVATREWRQRMIVRCTLGIAAQGTSPAQAIHTLGLTTEL
jgi:hypothetical protein